jgi:hypothetical protein
MPTPRPIITPNTVAKSGSVRIFDIRPMRTTPMLMPPRATPTGRPMASTDPKARMRMTMAKARPRTSELGSANSAKAAPPTSTWRPGTWGRSASISLVTAAVSSKEVLAGISSSAKAILPASAPSAAIWRSPPGAYGLVMVTSSRASILANNASMADRTAGSRTPWSARNTIVPVTPVPCPPKCSSRTSKPFLLSTFGRLNSSWTAVPTAPCTPPRTTSVTNHARATSLRRRKQNDPRRPNTGPPKSVVRVQRRRDRTSYRTVVFRNYGD